MERNTASQAQTKEWVDWMNVKVLQKAVVVDPDGNMLALRRGEAEWDGRSGKWDLPGGSMDPQDLESGEADPHAQAIKREIGEETGLKGVLDGVVCVASGTKHTSAGKVLVLAIGYRYRVDGVKPPVTLSNEHVEARWVSREKFLGLDFGNDGGFHSQVISRA